MKFKCTRASVYYVQILHRSQSEHHFQQLFALHEKNCKLFLLSDFFIRVDFSLEQKHEIKILTNRNVYSANK